MKAKGGRRTFTVHKEALQHQHQPFFQIQNENWILTDSIMQEDKTLHSYITTNMYNQKSNSYNE